MRKSKKGLLAVALAWLLAAAGCAGPAQRPAPGGETLRVVATTTMLADLSEIIGGDCVTADGLMGPGVDPHLYQASAGDILLMQNADVVVHNGLHLEGKMGEIFKGLSARGQTVVCIEEGLDESALLTWEGGAERDPHIWFDVPLWKAAAKTVADGFSRADPEHAPAYAANLDAYLESLDETDAYLRGRAAEVPEGQRVLITAHDAFRYFGRAYGFEVLGLQGASTAAEAGTADVSALASFITERKIKAVFIESSVPPKTIEALQAAVWARGFRVEIGGQLYSDSLGGEGSGAESYLLAARANIDTIVDALK